MVTSSDYWVMVPFYSNLDYLREALVSVISQTDQAWKCVVVDDSPGDAGVGSLVAALGESRISVVQNPTNLGVANSFNRCFELANDGGAELAMILHADDLLEADYVATMRTAHAGAADAVCVAPRVTVIDAGGARSRTVPDTVKALLWPRRLPRLQGERGLAMLARGQFLYCPAVSYRMSEVPVPAWNPRWKQVMDLELFAGVLLGGGSIALERSRVFRYRRHAQSMTQQNSVTSVRTQEETELLTDLARRAEQVGWSRARRAAQVRVTVRLQSLLGCAAAAVNGDFRSARRALIMALVR